MLRFLTAKSHNVKSNFKYIDWQELITKIESPKNLGGVTSETAKNQSEIIAATDAIDKTKANVLAHDNFTMLRLDLDETKLDVDGIDDALNNMSITSFIIHTTASHRQHDNGNRYRVYIELATSLSYEVWATLETYLSYIFMADDCAARPQQIMYLPMRYKGDSYQYHIAQGDPLTVEGSELLQRANSFKQKQSSIAEAAIKDQPTKTTYNEKLIGCQVSIIEAINQSYDWENLLLSYGYKRQGKAYLPPEATSKLAGAYILTSNTDGKQRYYSHHQNDPCATGKCLDIFDVICIRNYGGDTKQALRTIAETHFPKFDKHNKKEWVIEQQNIKSKALFVVVEK
jgi:hypothetical protein